jgi:hypothetical protein
LIVPDFDSVHQIRGRLESTINEYPILLNVTLIPTLISKRQPSTVSMWNSGSEPRFTRHFHAAATTVSYSIHGTVVTLDTLRPARTCNEKVSIFHHHSDLFPHWLDSVVPPMRVYPDSSSIERHDATSREESDISITSSSVQSTSSRDRISKIVLILNGSFARRFVRDCHCRGIRQLDEDGLIRSFSPEKDNTNDSVASSCRRASLLRPDCCYHLFAVLFNALLESLTE